MTQPLLQAPSYAKARSGLWRIWFVGVSAWFGCSGNDTTTLNDAPVAEPDEALPGEPPVAPVGQTELGPVYALLTISFNAEEPTSYVSLSDTLDISAVDLSNALEVPGFASIAAAAGQLLVSSATSPTITRYQVTDELRWIEGESLSFANLGVTYEASFLDQYWRDDRLAFFALAVLQNVHWDPTGFEIRGVLEDAGLPPERGNLQLFASSNRSYYRPPSGPVMRPFVYHDQDWYVWAPDTQIVVHDQAGAVSAVVDAPCPGLDLISRDEAGNSYFSTWNYYTLHAVTGAGPAPCVVRMKPDGSLDTEWNPPMTEWTGGRHFRNFRYMANGKAMASVLHFDEFPADIDFDSLALESFWEIEGSHHHLWVLDLNAGEAHRVPGVAPEDDTSVGVAYQKLGGRSFVFAGQTAYEYDETQATLSPRFPVQPGVTQWVQIR